MDIIAKKKVKITDEKYKNLVNLILEDWMKMHFDSFVKGNQYN